MMVFRLCPSVRSLRMGSVLLDEDRSTKDCLDVCPNWTRQRSKSFPA